MAVIDLLVKGTTADMVRAAREHRLPVPELVRETREDIVVGRIPAVFESAVESWLSAEIKRRPYPPGTLITYSVRAGDGGTPLHAAPLTPTPAPTKWDAHEGPSREIESEAYRRNKEAREGPPTPSQFNLTGWRGTPRKLKHQQRVGSMRVR